MLFLHVLALSTLLLITRTAAIVHYSGYYHQPHPPHPAVVSTDSACSLSVFFLVPGRLMQLDTLALAHARQIQTVQSQVLQEGQHLSRSSNPGKPGDFGVLLHLRPRSVTLLIK